MDSESQTKKLVAENTELKQQLEEYKDLVNAIRNGAVDALAIKKDGQPDIFTLESTDFIYRVLVENFAESALNVSDKGLIIYANPAFQNLLSSTEGSIIGSEIISLVDPKDKRTFEKLFRDAFSGASKGEITLSYKGKTKVVYASLSSLYPRFQGIGINIVDLSAKKQQEAEISGYKTKLTKQDEELLQGEISRKSIEKFRFMGDTMPQKVWTTDAEGNINYFNKKWFDYTKLLFEELKDWGWKKIIHPEDWPETERKWTSAFKSGTKFEVEHRILNADQEYRWHLTRAIPQMDNDNITMWVGTSTDVHSQKNFSDDLGKKVNEATVFLQTIFDSSEELITSLDTDLNFTSVNEVAADYIKSKPRDVIGKNLLEVFPFIKDTDQYETILKVMKGETIHSKETIRIHGENIIFDSYCKPLVIKGVVNGVLIVARDITSLISITNSLRAAKQLLEEHTKSIEEKNNELTNANAELRSFTYIASHDLKEPLRKIMVFSSRILTEEKNDLSPGTLKFFERINASVTHMQNLIDALLSYSKINDNQFTLEKTDLNQLVDEVQNELREMIEDRNVTIEYKDLPTLNIVPFQFSQLFNNLISNAIKYSHQQTDPRIVISASIVNAKDITSEHPLTKERYWHISVGDNGIGFDQAYQFKIFELFQRLHGKGEFPGTGIGLAICNKVVQNHNGLIRAVGNPGHGAIFSIYLPIYEGADQLEKLSSDNGMAPGQAEAIDA